MTRLGVGTLALGVVLAALGWIARWPPVLVVGAGILGLVLGSIAHVIRRPNLNLRRQIEPARVEKGRAAVAVVHATNRSRRTIGALEIDQQIGPVRVAALLPRLRAGESGLRAYRLPTTRRGVFDIGPIEVSRGDPFGLCRTVQKLGEPQRISVHPRLLDLNPLPTGVSRNLEGPSSDMSPQGTITFHRLREYVVGDDLRTIHWPTTARLGKLVVRHNVDTAQPDSVVLLDLRPSVYSQDTFESAVDISASLVSSLGVDMAPVQLRTTTGDRLGGRSERDPTPIIDYLTGVEPDAGGTLGAQLMLLRRDRGGTALVVVTGRLDLESVPSLSACRRRFDRVIVISLVARSSTLPAEAHITFLNAATADQAAWAWNTKVSR